MTEAKGSTGHEEWGTKLGVVLAVAGSAVGLGNFLRFPWSGRRERRRRVHDPVLLCADRARHPDRLGRVDDGSLRRQQGLHSAPAIMGMVGKGAVARYLGILGVLIPLGVSFYYVFIETWCLGYCLQFIEAMFGGPGVGVDPNASIETQTQGGVELLWQLHRRGGQRGRVLAVWRDGHPLVGRDRREHLLRVPRPLEGHREVLLVGHAGDGHLRVDRAACAC